jgi:hypothetical protein
MLLGKSRILTRSPLRGILPIPQVERGIFHIDFLSSRAYRSGSHSFEKLSPRNHGEVASGSSRRGVERVAEISVDEEAQSDQDRALVTRGLLPPEKEGGRPRPPSPFWTETSSVSVIPRNRGRRRRRRGCSRKARYNAPSSPRSGKPTRVFPGAGSFQPPPPLSPGSPCDRAVA